MADDIHPGSATPGHAERLRVAVGAWQPFTGGGVAAFGAASVARTLTFQLLFAFAVALVVVWCARHAWFPPFTAALGRLPEEAAEIHNGHLIWPDTNAVVLGEDPQLAIVIDPTGTGELGRSADLQLELRTTEIRLNGIFGHQFIPYPPGLDLPLDRFGGAAAWGAWNWVGLALLGAATVVVLFLFWWSLALVLALPVRIAAIVFFRALTLGGACRLVAAAWLPATMVLAGGVFLYATHWVRLPGLAVVIGLHVLVGLFWLSWGLLLLPGRMGKKAKKNPFKTDDTKASAGRKSATKKNPFR